MNNYRKRYLAVPHGCGSAWCNRGGECGWRNRTGNDRPVHAGSYLALGSAAIGGLAGLLAPSSLNR